MGVAAYPLTRHQSLLLAWTGDEDFALAAALLDAERTATTRQWDALERLLAAVPRGGTYEEVLYLPRERARAALRDLFALGWNRDWDEYADAE